MNFHSLCFLTRRILTSILAQSRLSICVVTVMKASFISRWTRTTSGLCLIKESRLVISMSHLKLIKALLQSWTQGLHTYFYRHPCLMLTCFSWLLERAVLSSSYVTVKYTQSVQIRSLPYSSCIKITGLKYYLRIMWSTFQIVVTGLCAMYWFYQIIASNSWWDFLCFKDTTHITTWTTDKLDSSRTHSLINSTFKSPK